MKKDHSTEEATINKLGQQISYQDVNFRDSQAQSISKTLHFFVRLVSGGNTIVIHANSDDSVESVHEQIRKLTGIPLFEQGLVYRGRQLQWEQTLEECFIENDAGLHLIGRMRSTEFPKSWQVVNDLLSSIRRLCKGEGKETFINIKSKVEEFLDLIPKDDHGDKVAGHLKIFKSYGAPTALVMLYLYPIHNGNKDCADEAIRLLLSPNLDLLAKPVQVQFASIILEFCKLLSGTAPDDSLYIACRSTLGSLLDIISFAHGSKYFDFAKSYNIIIEFLPFVHQLADKLIEDLESSWNPSPCTGSSLAKDVRDFTSFLRPLCGAIEDQVGGKINLPMYLHNKNLCYMAEFETLFAIFKKLLEKIDQCLHRVEEILISKGAAEETESPRFSWYQYIPILKELNGICKLYRGAEHMVSSLMKLRRLPLNFLIRYLKRSDDHYWLLEHKDVTDFESRRHLVMMMFPEIVDDYEELHEMLIDRSQLLEESFAYISRADPESFRSGLFMEFKNEEATGPGVVREWFYLVCQAIFNPQNPLFQACPNDQRRFFPNPVSKVDSLHLDYFGFCGRMIALALMNKVHVGIVLDRVFFLQLAGNSVSLDDIRDADPCLYMSCKKILEMDAEFVDSDALGLTFVREVEELGSRKIVELCAGGKDIVVDSKNRAEYVNLLIQNCFVSSISQQVDRFARGFADIISTVKLQKQFFISLELEDLDRMLCGSDSALCVKAWKAHTDYHGYKETDHQICWFWKIVEGMSAGEQRVLLFFWTSVRYLPIEGFGGLPSRLHIYKASDSHDRLPSSHTCFYRLCLPPYPSIASMQKCLNLITQEHRIVPGEILEPRNSI
ncbi:E3 ubiquitin-protein ligase upl5-like [Thalictrum thalictroides]|uniref:HECT-type E3 ubiquitin transferase n=1 Tax=Thalictrum thalictroides TaxID=46969 RepID=A0A7J6WNY8_THATH|nr:E3 ubiquitin-protein ligase upl5-like [Thalictrum thalictroides]